MKINTPCNKNLVSCSYLFFHNEEKEHNPFLFHLKNILIKTVIYVCVYIYIYLKHNHTILKTPCISYMSVLTHEIYPRKQCCLKMC